MKNKGFTIIELLVAVAIIGLLAALAITQYSSAQQKARDAKRMSDVREINKALQLYETDHLSFPVHTTEITITGTDDFSTALEEAGVITAVPADPQHPGSSYSYQSNSSGDDYDISFCLETNDIPNYSQGCGNTLGP